MSTHCNANVNEQLRAQGFKIHARPLGKPAVWEKDGALYEQPDPKSTKLEPKKRD